MTTLNIAEADDALAEKVLTHMQEPVRTLVGHFRHESSHYYWDRMVRNSSWIEEFRQIFGDERADYDEALSRHDATPVVGWHLNFISACASSHPWEDWSEPGHTLCPGYAGFLNTPQ